MKTSAGRFVEATVRLRQDLVLDPGSSFLKTVLANALYLQGDLEGAAKVYAELLSEAGGRPLLAGNYGMTPNLRYAWILRQYGKEQAALDMLALVDRDFEAKLGTRFERGSVYDLDHAQRAWLDGDRERSLEFMRRAVDAGARPRFLFDEPMMAPLAGDPEFAALGEEVEAYLAEEKRKTLDLICKHNPIPDSWQPLTSTCTP